MAARKVTVNLKPGARSRVNRAAAVKGGAPRGGTFKFGSGATKTIKVGKSGGAGGGATRSKLGNKVVSRAAAGRVAKVFTQGRKARGFGKLQAGRGIGPVRAGGSKG